MKRLAGTLISAFLVALSFPPHDLGFVAWVGLVPLFLAMRGESPGRSFLYAYLFGTVMMMGVYFWINVVKGFSPVHFLLLAVVHCAFYALFGLLLNHAVSALRWSPVFIAPVVWVTVEFLRSNAGFLALPWPNLGNSQYRFPAVIQIASVSGVYGVSFLIVMVNAAIAELLAWTVCEKERGARERPAMIMKHLFVAILSVGGVLVFGYLVIGNAAGGKKVTATVIQGNVPHGRRWDAKGREEILSRQLDLSEAATRKGDVSLIVWSETSVPGSYRMDPTLIQAYSGLAARSKAFLIVGSPHTAKMRFSERVRIEKMYNSAFLFSPQGSLAGEYRKIRLLPFGEYLPWRGKFPWPSGIVSAVGDDFAPGRERTIFRMDDVPLAVPICWESLFPEHFRLFVEKGARLMVNITNEAWFGETPAPYQFLAMNVFRAVENRTSIVRCANSGVSCFIGPTGEIYGTVNVNGKELFVEGFLTKEVPLRKETTFYTRHGDIFAFTSLVLTCIGALGCAVLKDGEAACSSGWGT